MDKFENFENAFNDGGAGCRGTCSCGMTFYNPDGGWDWTDGELEELEASQFATAVDYAVEMISFDGSEYVMSCTCWQSKAKLVIGFMDSHAHKIADYFKLEKSRKQQILESAAEIDLGQ